MRHTYKIFLLILLFAQACDRVKDTPEPDYFQEFEPKKITVTTEPGQSQVWVNILDFNQIKAEYRLEIGEPAHGVLSPGFVPGGYLYTANPSFTGTDSVTYRICFGAVCKDGVIYFIVSPAACRIKALDDMDSLILADTLMISVLDNDTACGGVFLKSIANFSGPGTATIVNDSIRLILPDYYDGTVNFSYTMGDSNISSTAQASVKVSTDDAYCNAHFAPVNDTLVFYNQFNFRVFKPEELIVNDIGCLNSININSFTILSAPIINNVFELKPQNNRWWFIVKDTSTFTSGTFEYQLCTNSGTCRKATVVIRKP